MTRPDSSDSAAAPLDVLNEVATLLIHLQPGDLRGVVQVQTVLDRLRTDLQAPAPVRAPISEAFDLLDGLLLGQGDAAAVTERVGELVEHAMFALDAPDAEPADAPAEAAAPRPAAAAPTSAAARVAASPSAGGLPADVDRELLPDFIMECREYMESAEAALLALETSPDDPESVNVVFRAFHTIKGTSAFLGFTEIAQLAHQAETLFDRFRRGELTCTGPAADLSLRCVDTLSEMLAAIDRAAAGRPLVYPDSYGSVLDALIHADFSSPSASAPAAEPEADAPPPPPRLGDLLVAAGKVDRATLEAVAANQGGRPLGEALVASGVVSEADIKAALQKQQKAASGLADGADASVRVRMDRLDQLLDLVGELVVAQSMIVQDPVVSHGDHLELARKVGQANKIVRELQDLSMSMRMVPLRPVFQKIQRLVRDVARKSGKEVELITVGEDTEIDRNMADLIADPLVHMVRNAIDHGIEAPADRERAGKPRTGTVRLSAYHAGGNVVIQLADDGKGLNRERILAKALEKGLVEPDRNLADREIFNLIFAPGFSTADQITDLSGRGVGMDVVKRNIESIRGRIDINSAPGEGSTFSLRLPLTLAITDGMLVRVGEERFIVPTVHIYMSFRPEAGALSSVYGRGEMVMLQGEVVPILRLHRVFDVPAPVEDPTRGLLVIVGDANRRSALLVDELLGQQQFVAKPLGEGLGKIGGIAGGAILGDGRVGLILDTTELMNLETHDAQPSGAWASLN